MPSKQWVARSNRAGRKFREMENFPISLNFCLASDEDTNCVLADLRTDGVKRVWIADCELRLKLFCDCDEITRAKYGMPLNASNQEASELSLLWQSHKCDCERGANTRLLELRLECF